MLAVVDVGRSDDKQSTALKIETKLKLADWPGDCVLQLDGPGPSQHHSLSRAAPPYGLADQDVSLRTGLHAALSRGGLE